MESITKWFQSVIFDPVPELDNAAIPGKPGGKLRLTPEQLLRVIHARELADWSLQAAKYLQAPRLKRGPGGRPAIYRDNSILLMAIVQAVWRKSYEQIVDYVASLMQVSPQNWGLALGRFLKDNTGNAGWPWGSGLFCSSSWP